MWITTIVLTRVCKAMCNTALMEKKVSMFLTILLMKMYHPNHIADDQLSLGKKSSFMKNMVIVQMLTVWQVLEELHCLLPQQEGRMKPEDAVQIRKQKQHGACNIKQLRYLENITLKRVCAAKTSVVNRTEVSDAVLEVELQTGPNLLHTLAKKLVQ